MTGSRLVQLGDVFRLVERDVRVEGEIDYPLMGVRSFGRGPFAAGAIIAGATKYPVMRRVHEGDLVYPKLMAWEGAYALVPAELDGRYVSPEFCTFIVNEQIIDQRLLVPWFLGRSSGLSCGRMPAGRTFVGVVFYPEDFLATSIALPSLRRQQEIIYVYERSLFAGVSRSALDSFDLCGTCVSKLVILSDHREAGPFPFGELMQLRRTPVKIDAAGQYFEIGIRSFGCGVFIKPSISGSEILSKRVFEVEPNDLLLSNVFSWEGVISVADDSVANCIGSHRFLTYVPRSESVDPNYLRAYLLSDQGLAAIR